MNSSFQGIASQPNMGKESPVVNKVGVLLKLAAELNEKTHLLKETLSSYSVQDAPSQSIGQDGPKEQFSPFEYRLDEIQAILISALQNVNSTLKDIRL